MRVRKGKRKEILLRRKVERLAGGNITVACYSAVGKGEGKKMGG